MSDDQPVSTEALNKLIADADEKIGLKLRIRDLEAEYAKLGESPDKAELFDFYHRWFWPQIESQADRIKELEAELRGTRAELSAANLSCEEYRNVAEAMNDGNHVADHDLWSAMKTERDEGRARIKELEAVQAEIELSNSKLYGERSKLKEEIEPLREMQRQIAEVMGCETSISVALAYITEWHKYYQDRFSEDGVEAEMQKSLDEFKAGNSKPVEEIIETLQPPRDE